MAGWLDKLNRQSCGRTCRPNTLRDVAPAWDLPLYCRKSMTSRFLVQVCQVVLSVFVRSAQQAYSRGDDLLDSFHSANVDILTGCEYFPLVVKILVI